MAVVTFAPGTVILKEGASINQLLIISSGNIHASSEKGELFLEKGDAVSYTHLTLPTNCT